MDKLNQEQINKIAEYSMDIIEVKQAGGDIKEYIKNDYCNEFRVDETKALQLLNDFESSKHDYFTMREESAKCESADEYISKSLTAMMDKNDFSQEQRYEFLSKMKLLAQKTNFLLLSDRLNEEKVDLEGLHKAVEAEYDASFHAASMATSEDIELLMGDVLGAADGSALFANPELVAEAVSVYTKEHDMSMFDTIISKNLLDQDDLILINAYATYKAMLKGELGKEAYEAADPKVVAFNTCASCEQAEIIRQVSQGKKTFSAASIDLELIGSVVLVYAFNVCIGVLLGVNPVTSVLLTTSVLLSTAIIISTVAAVGITVMAWIDKEFREKVVATLHGTVKWIDENISGPIKWKLIRYYKTLLNFALNDVVSGVNKSFIQVKDLATDFSKKMQIWWYKDVPKQGSQDGDSCKAHESNANTSAEAKKADAKMATE